MKNSNLTIGGALLAFAMFLAGLAVVCRGVDVPLPQAFNTTSGTVLSAPNTGVTNSANTNGLQFFVEPYLYHTFQITTTCTNSASVYLDRSLDAVGWIPFSTNTSTSTATNEVTITGKWSYVRGRFTGTNASATVLYLGGR